MTLVRPELSCEVRAGGPGPVVSLVGELDLSSAPVLAETLDQVLDRCPQVVTLDLSGLDFIDSTGLSLLARTSKALKGYDGRLRLLSPRPAVRRVLELVGLHPLLVG